MSRVKVTFDSRQFDAMVKNLTGPEIKKAMRRTLRASATILKKETERSFRSGINIRRDKMTYRKGRVKITVRKQLVKIVSDKKDKQAVKVHIMDNFKAKFFEKGTDVRYTNGHITGLTSWGKRTIFSRSGKIISERFWGKRKITKYQGFRRGTIKAGWHFRKAQQLTERRIFENTDRQLSKEIINISKKK